MSRVIHRSQAQNEIETKKLLGAVLAAELVVPSTHLWLVAPSVADMEMLDNSAGMYTELSRFGRRAIRLAEVLGALADRGASIVVVTSFDQRNRAFRHRLEFLAQDLRVSDRVRFVVDDIEQSGAKTLVGDDFVLTGGMDLTYGGIELRECQVELRADLPYVTEARMEMWDRFGDAPR
ncbi:phospholipase D-like domain-containing protein DpdK [Micromonospora cathayae]|uniref:Phospholipase D-like domain-containing protein DpdK n=1 Tax=Micromonospora cathayae TaxID=3028804 RepID=A0ABY7ZQC3_9ACTN|nr:phospholipase D-like domain-containing protein DpdK [Micromonospora sp. HUAS 3]WDZ84708.1 phospholipase D-like domain-containing protein DpdK [Micromonospora sp. HUAS 3]